MTIPSYLTDGTIVKYKGFSIDDEQAVPAFAAGLYASIDMMQTLSGKIES